MRPENGPESGHEPLLHVTGLSVDYTSDDQVVRAVDSVHLEVNHGEIVALVGESGSGKSTIGWAISGLLEPSARITGGRVRLSGIELLELEEHRMDALRGSKIGIVFQDPLGTLNPLRTIGSHLTEALRIHEPKMNKDAAMASGEAKLKSMMLANPKQQMDRYAHQMSGGQQQRALIAAALCNSPDLIIADEPTTALDVTTQAQVLRVLKGLRDDKNAGILLITHDLGVVAEVADRILVMYAGRIVEVGAVRDIYRSARHPYTRGLLGSRPVLDNPELESVPIRGAPPPHGVTFPGCAFEPRCPKSQGRSLCRTEPPELLRTDSGWAACHFADEADPVIASSQTTRIIASDRVYANVTDTRAPRKNGARVPDRPALEVINLTRHYRIRARRLLGRPTVVRAVDGVSLSVKPGRVLAVVGESGSGKTTLAQVIMKLEQPSAGSIHLLGEDVTDLTEREFRPYRKSMQLVMQNPLEAFHPRMSIGQSIGEPLRIHDGLRRDEREERIAELLEMVGLERRHIQRLPHEFSGGQRQRIAIARAISTRPSVLILDEPVSALDVSVQTQVLDILDDLRTNLGIAQLLIAHDLSVVRTVSDDTAVMYMGRVVEYGPTTTVFGYPTHPYTQALLSSAPIGDPALREGPDPRIVLEGDPPDPTNPPSGCAFRTRCWKAQELCAIETPLLERFQEGESEVACLFAEPVRLGDLRPARQST